MRVRTLLAAAALTIAGASAANAAITITQTVVPGTGDLLGFQINKFFAKSTAENGEGLQSVNWAFDTLENLKIKFAPLNAHPTFATANDADIFGQSALLDGAGTGIDARTATSGLGTFARATAFFPDDAGTPGDQSAEDMTNWFAANVEPGPTGRHLSSPSNPNPSATYGAIKHLRVVGILQGQNDSRSLSDPNGTLFAVAVVPVSGVSPGTFNGQLAGSTGPIATFSGNLLPVPEPGAVTFVGLAAASLLGRRRRA